MKISPARTAAYDILFRIENEKAFSSILLPIFEEELSDPDRSLCHELVLGTLRRQLYLDRVIDLFSNGKKLDIEVRLAIRIALYQILYLTKIPSYSAINESVNLVQRAKKTSAKGFVNAILRRASRETPELAFTDEIDRISIETSHPYWLIQKWVNALGMAEAEKFAAANNDIPAIAFRLISPMSSDIQALLDSSTPSDFVEGCYIAQRKEPLLWTLATSGDIYIQDESSQMIAQAVEPPPAGYFLDVCAAPGGKTGLVAKNNRENAKLVVAGDLHSSRVAILRENCRRQDVTFVNILQYDAERGLPFAEHSFDTVLVDAPCSGTGTIRSNPEIRYSLKPGDLPELSSKQLSILKNASKVVRPGGALIYSTCSVEKEEDEDVSLAFLNENSEFRAEVPSVAAVFLTKDGFVRTWPQRDNTDGFFAGVFRRRI